MSGKGIVHLVDDEESLRRSTSFVLKTSGYGVVTYESGPAFLQKVAHAEPGCVLLDVRMPELDGLGVQRALHERGVAMQVIVFTGHGAISIPVQALWQGAGGFFEKTLARSSVGEGKGVLVRCRQGGRR